ncbi:heavy metal-associated isoprenylated plant protein 35-like [Gastrolobium bilobum]|uniref:heavy metal-associated isoprenylated plant protein 35-like n=1 Tax=Gastrolobium bilobum TaxID=150636 RepID=UPI002AB30FAF|nr:heavy metal-associated isoprenylated plant protein 35-like [Gastrolobium bilobum]
MFNGKKNAAEAVCPSVVVTLYFDNHPSLPAHFASLTECMPPRSTSTSLSVMDAKTAEVASEPLKYKTWFLKIYIHCEGCRRKVKKVLKNIDGVFTTTIDPQQHKVTVTRSVGVETLLRKLVRAGKHAEIWPENVDGKGKSSKKKRNGQRDPESLENKGTENVGNCKGESKSSKSKTGDNNPPKKSQAGNQVPPEDRKGCQSEGGVEGTGKKKKKKAQGGGNGSNGLSSESTSALAHTGFQFQNLGQVVGQQMGQMNLNPTRQQSYSYLETGYPPMVYVATMGRNVGPSYYVPPPSPCMCAGLDQDSYQFQSTPLVSFEIFSDENANGCSIM